MIVLVEGVFILNVLNRNILERKKLKFNYLFMYYMF